MKTFIAAALVAFTVSNSAFAFEITTTHGMPDGIQEMSTKQGKPFGVALQNARQSREGSNQQQQVGRGSMQDMMESLMNGDIGSAQEMAGSLGQ